MTRSIMLVGVGGQGIILAGSLLSRGLMEAGYDIKVSEIVGMSQRGGAVSTHIRCGEAVASPVIEPGGCDLLVAFEQMEAARSLHYLSPGGTLIVNTLQLPPTPVTIGEADYPDDLPAYLSSQCPTVVLDAQSAARDCGSLKVSNVVMLGAAVRQLGLEGLDWHSIVKSTVPAKFAGLNLAAFDRGLALGAC